VLGRQGVPPGRGTERLRSPPAAHRRPAAVPGPRRDERQPTPPALGRFGTAWPSHQGIRIQQAVPCLHNRAVLTKETQKRSPRWPKPALLPQTQTENPLKAEWLRNNYSFGTKLQLVNIKSRRAKNERNEWLCVGEESKEGECDSLGLSSCWPYRWIREGNWMLMKS